MLELKIRARSVLLGISIPTLAELSGVPLRTLQANLSTGRFSPESLAKLGSTLGVSPSWFESDSEDVGADSAELLRDARL